MGNKILRRVRMYWREKLQMSQFIAHNKLCFDLIVLPMSYKVHARQTSCIESPRMKRAKFACVLQRSKKVLRLVLPGRRIVHLLQDH